MFRVLLSRSMMPAEDVLARVELKVLSGQDARDVMALYAAPAKPITVVRE